MSQFEQLQIMQCGISDFCYTFPMRSLLKILAIFPLPLLVVFTLLLGPVIDYFSLPASSKDLAWMPVILFTPFCFLQGLAILILFVLQIRKKGNATWAICLGLTSLLLLTFYIYSPMFFYTSQNKQSNQVTEYLTKIGIYSAIQAKDEVGFQKALELLAKEESLDEALIVRMKSLFQHNLFDEDKKKFFPVYTKIFSKKIPPQEWASIGFYFLLVKEPASVSFWEERWSELLKIDWNPNQKMILSGVEGDIFEIFKHFDSGSKGLEEARIFLRKKKNRQ